jgi:hypothetical protein
MNELLDLGLADGESRWIGVRRHQAALAIAGIGIMGEWLTQVHGDIFELVLGVVLLSCAAPTKDGLTVGERLSICVNFAVRSRWTSIRATQSNGTTSISARGDATVRGYELKHRGRLDLSGRDRLNSLALGEFADALSTLDETRHFSLHVRTSSNSVTTLLATPLEVSPPLCWSANTKLVGEFARDRVGVGAGWLLERWAYVRNDREVVRVLRIRDFSSVPDGRAFLERMQFASPTLDVVVHVDVMGGIRAHRLAARAVHRVGSDDAASRAAGFRRTAQSSRTLERLRQRESLVADGAALLRIAVFIVIRANSMGQLRRDVKAVTRTSVESGLRCEPGHGRQALWYCAQLPGGPGW